MRRKPLQAQGAARAGQAVNGGDFQSPRFFADGNALLLARLEPDADGRLIPDLYRFEVATGELRRLTCGAGLRDADPLPGGREAGRPALPLRQGRAGAKSSWRPAGKQILEAPPFPVSAWPSRGCRPTAKAWPWWFTATTAWRLEVPAARPAGEAPGAPAAARAPWSADPAWSRDGDADRTPPSASAAGSSLRRFGLESG